MREMVLDGEDGTVEHDVENSNEENSDSERPSHFDVSRYRVKPGTHFQLSQFDTCSKGNYEGNKSSGKALLKKLTKRLAELQELFYAQGKHRLLIVLQAMDTGGKDGTIAHVFDEVNPQGVNVASFKRPTPIELAHDYLWRIHACVPGNGEIVIFNRSHYEDVLVARVHNLVPKEAWQRRYEHINAFERMLTDEGTTIVKFFLYISKEEQRERLQSRLDNPSKHWKFNVADLSERKRWDEYMSAYEDAIHHTSTDYAPWYIIPADRKWYRNLVVAKAIIQTIEALQPSYPTAIQSLEGIVID